MPAGPVNAESVALRRAEVARELGISLDTVDRMILDGRLRCIRSGRIVLVPRAAVLALLAGQPEGGAA